MVRTWSLPARSPPTCVAFPDDNARFTTTVKQGKNNMPPWKDILSDQEITEVWAFVSSRRKQ